jgi:hypothetical protein
MGWTLFAMARAHCTLPRVKRVLAVGLCGFLLAGGVALYVWKTRPVPEDPARLLFRQAIPEYGLARARHRGGDGKKEREALFAAAASAPALFPALEALSAAWPDERGVKDAVADLDDRARKAALPYWIDAQSWNGLPLLLAYDLAGSSRWTTSERAVEVLRVRRLDSVNVEMGLLGHNGGERAVVLLDRVEDELMGVLDRVYQTTPPGNEVDRIVAKAWRARVEERAGAAALSEAAAKLGERKKAFQAMEKRLGGGSVSVVEPDRFAFGEAFFESLAPFAETGRRGGPLVLSADLETLRQLDLPLRAGPLRAALEVVLDLEAGLTEAHEARHALDRRELLVPPELARAVGEDDPDFARLAERELRAYLGELADGEPPPCLAIRRIATIAFGKQAHATPHHFAGQVLLPALLEKPPESNPELVRALCDARPEAIRAAAAKAWKFFYLEDYRPAKRQTEALLTAPSSSAPVP